jgi:hypothetical protein
MERFTAIWALKEVVTEGTEYSWVDYTSNTKKNTSFSVINTGNDETELYLGFERRWTGFLADISTAGNYTNLNYSYYNGNGWVQLELIDNFVLSESKYMRFNMPRDWAKEKFSTTFPYTVASTPDSIERFWVKITVDTVTTSAIISKIRCLAYATYTNSDRIAEYLQFKRFDSTTTPTDLTVEDIIKRQEDRIDYKTKKSWRFNAVTEEQQLKDIDYNKFGVFLRNRNLIKIYSVKLWTGADWKDLTEGKTNDWFTNKELGAIYFSRLWTLPALYGYSSRFYSFGYGEFKNSMRVDYIYGKDKEYDSEFRIVEDIATKLVSADLLKHHDYSAMVVSGTNIVQMTDKVRINGEEAESRLEELSGVYMV